MTKNDLSQIYYLNREVRMWQQELARLECASVIKSPGVDGLPHGSGTESKVEKLAAEKEDIRIIIEGILKKIDLKRKEILEYINKIDDSYMRQVIYYRNVALMRWEKIADELGGSGDSHRKAYERFLINEKKRES